VGWNMKVEKNENKDVFVTLNTRDLLELVDGKMLEKKSVIDGRLKIHISSEKESENYSDSIWY
jgi:hypothetical protein